jgi:hypothetical protein
MRQFFYAALLKALCIFLIILAVEYLIWLYPNDLSFDSGYWKTRWNYYATLGIAFSAIVGIGGLLLGWFYYFHKLNHDQLYRDTTDHRHSLQLVLSRLEDFDELMMNFFFFNTSDPIDSLKFERIKSEISTSFDDIYNILDFPCVKITNEDLAEIIKVNQFVDKNRLITAKDPEEFRNLNPENQANEFRRLLTRSRQRCYRCMFSNYGLQ